MRFLVRLIGVFLSVRTQDTTGPTCSCLPLTTGRSGGSSSDGPPSSLLRALGWRGHDPEISRPWRPATLGHTQCKSRNPPSPDPLKFSPLPTTLPFWNGTARAQTWPQLRAWRTICQFINMGKSEILEFTRGESCGLVRTGMKCPNRYLPLPISLSLKKCNIWSSWQSSKVRSCF